MGIFNLFKKKRVLEDTEDFEKDLDSIIEFLAEVGRDVKIIYDDCVKIKKIRARERAEYDSKKQIKFLEDNIKAWDKFLERFVMFDRDTDITSERVKRISEVLKEETEKMEVSPEIKDMVKKKTEWVFNW